MRTRRTVGGRTRAAGQATALVQAGPGIPLACPDGRDWCGMELAEEGGIDGSLMEQIMDIPHLAARERTQKTAAWRADRADESLWKEGLPEAWRSEVVHPVFFVRHKEYEIEAERVIGYEVEDEPCYCKLRAVITELRSDEDDNWQVVPVYSEHLIAWRLFDGRWLVLRQVFKGEDCSASRAFFTFAEQMPR